MFNYKTFLKKNSGFIAALLGCIAILGSCDTYNFSQPQPVDKPDLYEFPASFCGSWIAKKDSDRVYIDPGHASFIIHEKEKICNGAWPRYDQPGNYISVPESRFSLQTIRYDSLKKPIDTTDNYIVKDGYIYEVGKKGTLSKGVKYQMENSFFIAEKEDTFWMDLGKNTRLRKLDNNIYAFNILNRTLGMENDWWTLRIFEKKGNGTLHIWNPVSKASGLPAVFYKTADNYYFNCNWTTAELLELMNKKYFVDETVLYRDKTVNK
jgi:hypothetical protein